MNSEHLDDKFTTICRSYDDANSERLQWIEDSDREIRTSIKCLNKNADGNLLEECRCVKPCSELDTVVFLQGQFEKKPFFKLAREYKLCQFIQDVLG